MSDCTGNLLNGDIYPVSRKVKIPTLKLQFNMESASLCHCLGFVIYHWLIMRHYCFSISIEYSVFTILNVTFLKTFDHGVSFLTRQILTLLD